MKIIGNKYFYIFSLLLIFTGNIFTMESFDWGSFGVSEEGEKVEGIEGEVKVKSAKKSRLDAVLENAIIKQNLEKVKLALENGANPNFINLKGNSVLMEAVLFRNRGDIKGNPKKLAKATGIIKLLLESGASPNIKNKSGKIVLQEILLQKDGTDYDLIKLFLLNGAETSKIRNLKKILSDLSLQKGWSIEKIRNFKNPYILYPTDFINLFNKEKENVLNLFSKKVNEILSSQDFETTKNLLKLRGIEAGTFVTFIKLLDKEKQEEVLRWLYTGFISNPELIEKLCDNLGVKNYWRKLFLAGLKRDLLNSFGNEELKDFTIIASDGTEIKANKLLLNTRSGLFRNMFLTVEKPESIVHDKMEFSSDTLQALVKLISTGELDSDLSIEKLEELSEAADFYQLSKDLIDKINKAIEK